MVTGISFQNGSFTSGAAGAGTLTRNGGVNFSNFYNTDVLERKHDYNEKRESYDISDVGKDSAIEKDIKNIKTYLEHGQEDKALSAYNSLLTQMSKQERFSKLAQNGDDSQLRTVAKQEIENTLGCDLAEFIEDNASSDAGTTYKKILFWGNADSTSSSDLLKEMCDLEVEQPQPNPIVAGLAAVASIITAPINFLAGNQKQ